VRRRVLGRREAAAYRSLDLEAGASGGGESPQGKLRRSDRAGLYRERYRGEANHGFGEEETRSCADRIDGSKAARREQPARHGVYG